MHFGKNYLNYTQIYMYVHVGIMFYLAATSLGKKKDVNEDIISMCRAGKKNNSKNVRLYERGKKNYVEHFKVGLHQLVLQLQLNYCIQFWLLHF